MNLDRRTLLLASASLAMFPATARAAGTAKVAIPDDKSVFEPAEVRIKAGDWVEWTNHALIEHTVTCDPAKAKSPKSVALPAGAAKFDSGQFGTDQTWRCQFTTPGRYRYFCILHEDMGMIGEIVVEA